ncbi:MAG: glycoside hydrolase family 78 protein [Acidobacteriota bacterium]
MIPVTMVLLVLALANFGNAQPASQAQNGPLAPQDLRCEYLSQPEAIDVRQPRFAWVLNHSARGQSQSAYQVLVSRAPKVVSGDVWDSGQVASQDFSHVAYAGKPLASGETYYWKVRYWDKDGSPSPYSPVARFGMGLLTPSDWHAKWIGSTSRKRKDFREVNFIQVGLGEGETNSGINQFRKGFNLSAKPVRARAYVSGLGYYELRINGKKVGDHVLDPGWTDYDKRVLYEVYDVTSLLNPGSNAIGAILGRGWFSERILLFQLSVEMDDGRKLEVVTDSSWKMQSGPIVSDNIYLGEVYDARLETTGWDQPGFDDATWTAATVVDPPLGVLSAQMMPPIRVVDTILPLKMTNPAPGTYVFDMGQNFSGWGQLRVSGPAGTRVKMRYAELLYKNGMLNTENLRRAQARDVYVLKGGGEEVYEPRFTYHGFRYVEVTGYPGVPKLDSLHGRVVHTDVKPTGSLAFSNQLLNHLQRMIVWGVKTNLHSIPTDCPQRDERFGWMGDVHWAAEAIINNFDMAAFYTSFLRSTRDVQGSDGSVPATVPIAVPDYRRNDPGYGAGYPAFVWYLYEHYGDRRILEEHYGGVKAWADYLTTLAKDGIVEHTIWGDWIAPMRTRGEFGAVWNGENGLDMTPGSLVSTFYYAYSVDVVAKAARLLNNPRDAEAYGKLASSIREAFNRKFFSPEKLTYASGSQASQTLALSLGVVPQDKTAGVLRLLVDDILYARDTHLSTGIVGTKYLMLVLSQFGRNDLAYELATQTTWPSWGHMAENEATTVWELWSNKTGPWMNSHNHPAFGSLGHWMYKTLAGINLDPEAPGYSRIRIQPYPAGDLDWVEGSMQTIRGLVISSWKRTPGKFTLEVTIPVGSEAEIHVPFGRSRNFTISEGDTVLWSDGTYRSGAKGIAGARKTDTAVVFNTGSGRYQFEMNEVQP